MGKWNQSIYITQPLQRNIKHSNMTCPPPWGLIMIKKSCNENEIIHFCFFTSPGFVDIHVSSLWLLGTYCWMIFAITDGIRTPVNWLIFAFKTTDTYLKHFDTCTFVMPKQETEHWPATFISLTVVQLLMCQNILLPDLTNCWHLRELVTNLSVWQILHHFDGFAQNSIANALMSVGGYQFVYLCKISWCCINLIWSRSGFKRVTLPGMVIKRLNDKMTMMKMHGSAMMMIHKYKMKHKTWKNHIGIL